MLISLLIFLLLSNAVTLRQDKSILFSRTVIIGLICSIYIAYNNLFINALTSGIGIYGGLFNVTVFTVTFNIYAFFIITLLLILKELYLNIIIINHKFTSIIIPYYGIFSSFIVYMSFKGFISYDLLKLDLYHFFPLINAISFCMVYATVKSLQGKEIS